MAKTSSHAGEHLEHHPMIHGHGEVGDGGLDVDNCGDHFGIVVSLGLGLRNLMRAMDAICMYAYILYISFSMERRQAGIL